MRAFLLAAGRGTRISRMIEAVPKCTLPVAGVPLIRRTALMLREAGFELVACVGYQSDKVRQALEGLEVTYYTNPFYEITNSIASLWFARAEIAGEMVLLNADVFLSGDILSRVMNNEYDACMAIDKTRTEVGDYFFATTDDGCIAEYGKNLPLSSRSCEYVGLARINKRFAGEFRERMEWLVEHQKYDLWWENILYSFTDNKEKDIHTVDVEGDFWSEIDYFDDYERILRYMKKEGIDI